MSDSLPVERRTFNDADAIEHARAGADAIRAINHLTLGGPLPAPLAYEILGHLTEAAQRIPQALNQLANGLTDSGLHYDLTDSPGRDPQYSIIEAGTHLSEAARRAEQLADLLQAARDAISQQGYRTSDRDV